MNTNSGFTEAETAGDGYPIWASAEEVLEGSMKSYSDDEIQKLVEVAVAAATSEMQATIDRLEAEKNGIVEEVDNVAQIAKLTETISDLQAQLDTAVIEAENAKSEHSALVALLEEVEAEKLRQAEIAQLRDERLAKVAEVSSFPEDYLASNADRWAAMSEETFEAACADYAAASKKDSKATETIPSETALSAKAETAKSAISAYSEVFGLLGSGVDVRKVL